MSARAILVVLRKELLDISRDRRAVFVMLVLPILLYPLIIIGFTQLTVIQMRTMEQRTSVVWVRGLASLPPGFLAHLKNGEKHRLSLEEEPPGKDEAAELSSGNVRAILVAPESLSRDVADVTTTAHVQVIYNGGVDASSEARRQILGALDEWRRDLVDARLEAHGLARPALEPVSAQLRDVAPKGAILGRMLAYILVMASLMGSFYPAIDLGAGEKERGTLETLLLAPVRRAELALGKFAAVFAIALLNTVMNLASLGLTFSHFGSFAGGAGADVPELASVSVSLGVVLVVLAVLVPTVAIFAALALAISTHAKSYKEGMSYMQPLVITSVLLSLASALPGIELSTGLCLVPVAGSAVLVRELLGGTAHAGHAALVVLSSAGYAALAINWVARLYETEEVLVRPAAAKGLDLLTRASPTSPGAPIVPTLPQALALAVTVIVAFWFLGPKLQLPAHIVRGLVVTLVGLVAAPTLLYAKQLKVDLRATFRLVPAPGWALVAAVLLGIGGNVLAQDVERLQARFTGERLAVEQAAYSKLLEGILGEGLPVALLVIAVLPAICEEVLYRGFVLSGLRRDAGAVPAVLASAFLFAVDHLDPARLASVTLLGVVLGALALRSGSIVPAMLCHFTNNAFALILAKGEAGLEAHHFFEGGVASWPVRLVALALVAGGLALLARGREARPAGDGAAPIRS
ncbi:CPBP family intramembrane metalloprotease [bacterium]|nr:CPBP family intramembrane metalloprotease [bacterium]